MNGRQEGDARLRRLLREADPAYGAPELDAAEVARLRRTVLGATEREPRSWLPWPAASLAFAAALAAVVVGLALWRSDLAWKPAPGENRAATSLAAQTPSTLHTEEPSPAREVSPTSETRSTMAATGTTGRPPAPTAAARVDVETIHRSRTNEAMRSSRRSPPRAIDSTTATPTDPAPAETVAAAQPASEPPQPYQLQLTAPGGTRIVWLLTSSSGR